MAPFYLAYYIFYVDISNVRIQILYLLRSDNWLETDWAMLTSHYKDYSYYSVLKVLRALSQ